MTSTKSVTTCIQKLRQALAAAPPECPTVRRKVRRLLADSGRAIVTQSFATDLDRALKASKVFTNRPVIGRPLFQDDWVEFSTRPFPPHAVCFTTEHDLIEFMKRAIGVLPPLDGLREIEQEFTLASRQRIDLLCEARAQSGKGDLVAIEFKRGDPGYGVVAQLDAYLDALAQSTVGKGRVVRGLIISAPDADAQSSAGARPRNRIDWYVYQVALHKMERAES